jgi:hypothetical protein
MILKFEKGKLGLLKLTWEEIIYDNSKLIFAIKKYSLRI